MDDAAAGTPHEPPVDPWRVLRRQEDRRRYLRILAQPRPEDGRARRPGPAAGVPRQESPLLRAPTSIARGATLPDPEAVRRYLRHSCDLTVHGGIAAALTHPLAVCALAEQYVLRRVGGVSAGAVVAAAAAAAELGRGAPDPDPAPTGAAVVPGFAGLAEVIGWLTGQDVAGQDARTLSGAGSRGDGSSGADGEVLLRGEVAVPGWPEQHRLARLVRPAPGARAVLRLAVALASPPGPGRGQALAAAAWGVAGPAGRRVGLLSAVAVLVGWAGLLVALLRAGQVPGWAVAVVAVPLLLTFAAAGAACTVAACVAAWRVPPLGDGGGLVAGVTPRAGESPRRREDRSQRRERRLDRLAGVPDPAGVPPLVEWVADRIDDLAGVPRPAQAADRYALTFGELWLGRLGARSAQDRDLLRRAAADPELRVVDLRLATTDLSAGRPHTVPFRRGADSRTAGGSWLFCHDCLVDVLPGRVVEQMILTSPGQAAAIDCPRHEGQTLHEMPDPWDLPVVAAARMSAAAPGLLSAVPLVTVEPAGEGAPRRARVHLFVDGALTGGFDVSAFDRLLPRWPTFGLDLEPPTGPDGDGDGDPAAGGWGTLPEQDGRPVRRDLHRTARPLDQVLATLAAVTGWQHRVQADLPGLRGRVARVRGLPAAAGPALLLGQADVLRLALRGHHAGAALVERFTGPDGGIPGQTGTDRYRWVRMRAALGQYRELSQEIGARLPLYSDLAAAYRVPAALGSWFTPPLAPGSHDPAWHDAAAAITHLRALSAGGVLDWDTGHGAPPVPPTLRIVPPT